MIYSKYYSSSYGFQVIQEYVWTVRVIYTLLSYHKKNADPEP